MFKKIIYILIIIFSPLIVKGQITDTIELSYTKSVYLIFSEEPKVDRGSEDVIVKVHENKVIIQAGVEGFQETNLFVQSGSEFFMFILKYTESPSKFIFNYQVRKNTLEVKKRRIKEEVKASEKKEELVDGFHNPKKEEVIVIEKNNELVDYSKIIKEKEALEKKEKTTRDFKTLCQWVETKNQNLYNKGAIESKISFIATNLYVDQNHFYLKLFVVNKSKIKYDIDFIRFSIKNIKRSIKKSAEQYIELDPIYVYNEDMTYVNGKEKGYRVYVFDKFTIENNKKLNIEMWELNGDRKLDFDFYAEDILKIQTID